MPSARCEFLLVRLRTDVLSFRGGGDGFFLGFSLLRYEKGLDTLLDRGDGRGPTRSYYAAQLSLVRSRARAPGVGRSLQRPRPQQRSALRIKANEGGNDYGKMLSQSWQLSPTQHRSPMASQPAESSVPSLQAQELPDSQPAVPPLNLHWRRAPLATEVE